MVLKGFEFTVTSMGIQESYHEGGRGDSRETDRPFLVLCDGVSTGQPDRDEGGSPSQAAAQLAEQSIAEYLDRILKGEIDKEAIKKAFYFANDRLLRVFDDEEHPIAVSAVVLALVPGVEGEELLVGGVGDCRVYFSEKTRVRQLFFDGQTPDVSSSMTPEERCMSLHNALGVADLFEVQFSQNPLSQSDYYSALTYGFYSQCSEEEIHRMTLHPHDAQKGIAAVVSSKTCGVHALRFMQIQHEDKHSHTALASSSSASMPLKNRERLVALTMSIFACALILFVTFQALGDKEKETLHISPSSTPHRLHPVAEDESLEIEKVTAESDWFYEEAQSRIRSLERERDLFAEQLDDLLARQNEEREDFLEAERTLRSQLREAMDREEQERERFELAKSEFETRWQQSQFAKADAEQRNSSLDQIYNERMEKLSGELETFKRKNEALQKQLSEIKQTTQPTKHQPKIARLQEQLQSQNKHNRELKNSLQKLRSELQTKEKTLESLKKSHAAYAERYRDLEQQIAHSMGDVGEQYQKERTLRMELEEQVVQLQEALQEKLIEQQRSESYMTEVKELETLLAEKEQALNQSQELVETLQHRVHQNEAIQVEYLALKEDFDFLSKELSNQQKETTRLHKNLALAQANQGKNSSTQQELDQVLEELEIKDQQLFAFQQEKQQLETLYHDLQASYQTQIQSYEERLDRLSQAQQSGSSAQQQMARELQEALTALEEQSEALDAIEATTQTITTRKSQLEQENQQLLADKASLMDKIESMEELASLYREEQNRREKLEKQYAAFDGHLQQQKKQLAHIQASRDSLVSELDRMRKAYEELALRQPSQERNQQVPSVTTSSPKVTYSETPDRYTDTISRIHLVERGETLSGISKRYYGSATRWKELLEANQDTLHSDKDLKAGMVLVIP